MKKHLFLALLILNSQAFEFRYIQYGEKLEIKNKSHTMLISTGNSLEDSSVIKDLEPNQRQKLLNSYNTWKRSRHTGAELPNHFFQCH